MQATAGEAITYSLRICNLGSDQYKLDTPLRDHARYFLGELGGRVWTLAPHWWRTGTSQVVIDPGVGSGGMPSDFSNLGKQGRIYVAGRRTGPLGYLPPDDFFALVNATPTPAGGDPQAYTLHGMIGNIPILYIYPVNASAVTLDIVNYNKRLPEMIDIPIAPVAAVGAAGNPNGVYPYRIVFNTGLGDTEGGFPSDPVTLANKQGVLSEIPISPARSVTGRSVYRPPSGSVQYKLVGTIGDNLTTDFTDDVLDANLGADIPEPADAISGMEQFPGDFHDVVMIRGLINLLKGNRGDGREQVYSREWDRWVKTLWADQKQGQNVMQLMPAYGEGAGTIVRPRSRLIGV